MNFNSLRFLVFFPAVLLLHRLAPKKLRWMLLLAASYFFYMSWDPRLTPLLLCTTAVSYFAALGIAGAARKRTKKLLLAAVCFVCLGTLFTFKYLNFFLGTSFDIVLPVGISFYTFQTLSYVIDVYRGGVPAELHFGYYALYVSLFPQLVAGPIERPGDLLPQLRENTAASREDMEEGLFWLVRGFCKKVVISDMLAPAVDAVYAAPEAANGLAALLATAFFAVQIYCDFSGYSEIALGAARMLGIRLTKNFDRPYSAVSIRDFWRRWHISLTRWFRDYLYIPLGGNRKGTARWIVNTLFVFLVSGLWHGANWTFALWGLYHGLLLVLERLLPERKRPLLTLALVIFGWIFFRSASVSDAFSLIRSISSPWSLHGTLSLMGLDTVRLVLLPLQLVLLALLDRETPRVATELTVTTTAFLVLAIAMAWLVGLASGADNAFIYFQF